VEKIRDNSREKLSNISYKNIENIEPLGVTIITPTNREENFDNLLQNYLRQDYKEKELIIILNKDSMNLASMKMRIKEYENISIFQLNESTSLGECLNYAADQGKYPYISRFDDDDYYSTNYLKNSMQYFMRVNTDIIGKHSYFVYFQSKKILAINRPGNENRYVKHVSGPTMIFKRKILNNIRFPHISIGEDSEFLANCIDHNYRIYSTDRYNHVVLRRSLGEKHTWKISDDEFLRYCTVIGKTSNYIHNISI